MRSYDNIIISSP